MIAQLPGYQEALTSAAFYIHADAGYLRFRGADWVAFIQRQSTNDISQLMPSKFLDTVLTSPAARILDVLVVFPAEPESHAALDALTLPGRGAQTGGFLRSRIFFMDKVEIEDLSATIVDFNLVGPSAAEMLKRAGADTLPSQGEIRSMRLGGVPARVFHQIVSGFHMLAPAEQAETLVSHLSALGAAQLSAESNTLLRVEAGLPSAGRELVEDYTPLEVGLEGAISSTKGCYTGQEVIARQLTYDKVTRRLVGLKLDHPARPGERLRADQEDQPAGGITSAALSPRFGAIALAVVRRPFNQLGTRLLAGEKGSENRAEVAGLPFSI